MQDHKSHVLPILIGETMVVVVFHTMSTIWVTSFVELPLVYSIWHPLKYIVAVTYHLFPSLMVAFSRGVQAADVPVPAIPRLIFMDHMFACLFVFAFKYKIRMQRKLGLLRGWCHRPMLASWNTVRLQGQAHAVHALLFDYALVLFLIW